MVPFAYILPPEPAQIHCVATGLALFRRPYLHLTVPGDALFCLGATVLGVHWITENRELSWYEGSLLLTLYAVMAMGCLLLGS